MIGYYKWPILGFLLTLSLVFGRDFRYSHIMEVPDLSFHPSVFTGLDVLEQMNFAPLHNKRIGIFCNQTAVNQNGRHLLNLLVDYPQVEVSIIFAPQYGLFSSNDKRLKIQGNNNIDPLHGARIVEVFGRTVKPPNWSMRNLDLIVVDFQDTGIRYSTYMATLTKIMEVANEWSIPVMVLDRPNPLRGDRVDGPVVRPAYQSFEGYHLVPIRHGLTLGEYALMINEMGWIKDLKRVDLTVIPMINWKRNYWFKDLGRAWINPAPDLKDFNTLLAYTGFGLVEGTNLNDGRGTNSPYMRVGAPWLSGEHLAHILLKYNFPGLKLKVVEYIPRQRPQDRMVPRYVNEVCSGIEIEITDPDRFDPLATATAIIVLVSQLYPREFQWAEYDRIDKLYGYDQLRVFAAQGKSPNYLPPLWFHDVLRFSEFRQRFLLYK